MTKTVYTVRKNSREAKEIQARATNMICRCLPNGFKAEHVHNVKGILGLWIGPNAYTFTKVRNNGNGTYTLRLHSNEWYDFDLS